MYIEKNVASEQDRLALKRTLAPLPLPLHPETYLTLPETYLILTLPLPLPLPRHPETYLPVSLTVHLPLLSSRGVPVLSLPCRLYVILYSTVNSRSDIQYASVL